MINNTTSKYYLEQYTALCIYLFIYLFIYFPLFSFFSFRISGRGTVTQGYYQFILFFVTVQIFYIALELYLYARLLFEFIFSSFVRLVASL